MLLNIQIGNTDHLLSCHKDWMGDTTGALVDDSFFVWSELKLCHMSKKHSWFWPFSVNANYHLLNGQWQQPEL